MNKYSNTLRAALLATVSTPLLVEPTVAFADLGKLINGINDAVNSLPAEFIIKPGMTQAQKREWCRVRKYSKRSSVNGTDCSQYRPKRSSADPIVKEIQSLLNDLGYPAGKPDGLYGKKTKNALQNFYKDRGDSYDGKADGNELEALRFAATPASPTPQNNETKTISNSAQLSSNVNPDDNDLAELRWADYNKGSNAAQSNAAIAGQIGGLFNEANVAETTSPKPAAPTITYADETVHLNSVKAYPVYENRRQLVSDVQYTTWLGYKNAERFTVAGFFAATDASNLQFSVGSEGRNLLQSYGSPTSLNQQDFDDGMIVADLTSAYRLSTGETIERHWEQRLSAIITSATLNVDVESDIQLSPPAAEGCETELHLLDKPERVFDLTDQTKTVTLNGQSLPFPAGRYNIAIKTTCDSFDELPVYAPKVMVNGQNLVVKSNTPSPIPNERIIEDFEVEMSSLPPLHARLVSALKDDGEALFQTDGIRNRNYVQSEKTKAVKPSKTGFSIIEDGRINLLDDMYEGELSDDLDKVLKSRHFKIDFDASEPGIYEFLVKTKTNLTDLWNRKHPYVSIRNVTDQTHIINHGAKIGYYWNYQRDNRNGYYNFHPTDHMRDKVVVAHGSFNSDGTTKELLIDLITMPVVYFTTDGRLTTYVRSRYNLDNEPGRGSLYPMHVNYGDTRDMILKCSVTSPCLVGDDVEIAEYIPKLSSHKPELEEMWLKSKMYQYQEGTSAPPLFMQAEIYVKGPNDTDFIPLNASHLVGSGEIEREVGNSWLDD